MAACIISTAQQASPKVNGHKEPARAQEIIEINFVEIHSSFIKYYCCLRLIHLRTYLLRPSGLSTP